MTKMADALDFDKQVCFSLYSAANAMVRAYRPLLDKLDLTYLQYIVMMILWQKEGVSVSALGEKMHLDSGTLTPLLKRLEAKGLVVRKVSSKDERVKTLFLTDAGRQLQEHAHSVPEQVLCKTKLSVEALYAFKSQCDDLLKALDS